MTLKRIVRRKRKRVNAIVYFGLLQVKGIFTKTRTMNRPPIDSHALAQPLQCAILESSGISYARSFFAIWARQKGRDAKERGISRKCAPIYKQLGMAVDWKNHRRLNSQTVSGEAVRSQGFSITQRDATLRLTREVELKHEYRNERIFGPLFLYARNVDVED
nr:hypothetical protein Iba_chr02dCG5650 [Ipomoea batatas]